jgi:hypothetical protein
MKPQAPYFPLIGTVHVMERASDSRFKGVSELNIGRSGIWRRQIKGLLCETEPIDSYQVH